MCTEQTPIIFFILYCTLYPASILIFREKSATAKVIPLGSFNHMGFSSLNFSPSHCRLSKQLPVHWTGVLPPFLTRMLSSCPSYMYEEQDISRKALNVKQWRMVMMYICTCTMFCVCWRFWRLPCYSSFFAIWVPMFCAQKG